MIHELKISKLTTKSTTPTLVYEISIQAEPRAQQKKGHEKHVQRKKLLLKSWDTFVSLLLGLVIRVNLRRLRHLRRIIFIA